MKFLEAFTNVFRVPDLRKRLLFALALLAVYRLGEAASRPRASTPTNWKISSVRTRGRSSATWISSAEAASAA